MFRKLNMSTEAQLEIQTLVEAEEQANKSGEFDSLYQGIKQDKDVADKKATEPEESADAGSGDVPDAGGDDEAVADDAAPDDAAEPAQGDEPADAEESDNADKDEDSDGAKPEDAEEESAQEEDKELKAAQEELKNLTYLSVANEGFSNVEMGQSVMSGAASAASFLYNNLKHVAKALAELGITYGPGIAKNVYKGFLYAFCKLVTFSYSSTTVVAKYLDRRINSFASIKENIDTLRKALEMLKEKETQNDVSSAGYTNQKVIDSLKAGDSVDLNANMDVLTQFLTTAITDLGTHFKDDIGAVRHIMSNYGSPSFKVPGNFLTVSPTLMGMGPSDVKGYEFDSELIQSFAYKDILPTNVKFIAHLPRHNLGNLNDFTHAYNKSKMFIGMDTASFKDVNSIHYMTLDNLAVFLDKLDHLCTACISHQALYESINRVKSSAKFGLKNYFISIAKSANKVSVNDSMVEYIYLKSMFVDKVYLSAAMDIHDYSAKVMTAALAYVKDNCQKLS